MTHFGTLLHDASQQMNEIRKYAYHEAGHAVVGYMRGHQFSIVKITPEGEAFPSNHATSEPQVTMGYTEWPTFEKFFEKADDITEIENKNKHEEWFSTIHDFAVTILGGPIAQYYEFVDSFEILPTDFWMQIQTPCDSAGNSAHKKWVRDLLEIASKSRFVSEFISPTFVDDNIISAEKLVQDNWGIITELAEVLIEKRSIYWDEAKIL